MNRQPAAVAEQTRLKEAGLDLLALPIVVLLLIALGDVLTGGDASVHVRQLAPFVPVLMLAWRFPHAIGVVLVMVGTAGAITYLGTIALPPAYAIATSIVAFLPPIVAGLLLVLASRRP